MPMAKLNPPEHVRPAKALAERGAERSGNAPRLPLPVPLLLQLLHPLRTMEDVQALAAQLASARARGCF